MRDIFYKDAFNCVLQYQRLCHKKSKKIARRILRKYDAIWTQRIKITTELEKMGDNIIGRINEKMPNLLLRNHDAPDISETAKIWGFKNAHDLLEYLLAYIPRKRHEKEIYTKLLGKFWKLFTFYGKPEDSYYIYGQYIYLLNMKTSDLAGIIARCNREAKSHIKDLYSDYDEVWSGKIRITPELYKYGREIVKELNSLMPGITTRDSSKSAVDQVAMTYKFYDAQLLIDWLYDYKPRGPREKEIAEELMRYEFGFINESKTYSEVPF